MRIATITASAKPIDFEDGAFSVDGEPSGLAAVLQFESLGALSWESEELRLWALSLQARPETQDAVQPSQPVAHPTQDPAYRFGRWLRTTFGTRSNPRWGAVVVGAAIAVVILAALVGRPVYWFAHDLMNPVQVRQDGALPNLPSLLGASPHDALRMLGTTDMHEWQDTPNEQYWESSLQVRLPDLSNEMGKDASRPPSNVMLYLDFDSKSQLTRARLGVNSDAAQVSTHEALVRAIGVTGKLVAGVADGYADSPLEMSFGHGVVDGTWVEYSVTTAMEASDAYPATMYQVFVGTLEAMMLPDEGFTSATAAQADVVTNDQPAVAAPDNDPPTADSTSASDSTIREDGTSAAALSEASTSYARQIGGVSHEGETLYVIVGASLNYEDLAQQRLDDATPQFGDMQSYFIVQKSDNFEGMKPGWFIAMEAYRDEAVAKENLEFARRGFENPYIKRVVVRTADPIPVYEDQVDGN